jgi:hypothetical protein
VVSFTPLPLYPRGMSLWYPLDRRLGGPQNRSGRGGGERNYQPLPGLEPLIIRPVAQRLFTKISRILKQIQVICIFKLPMQVLIFGISHEKLWTTCIRSHTPGFNKAALHYVRSRDSSVGIAIGYWLDDRVSRVRFPAGAGNFSLHHGVRTALGPTQPPIQWIQAALSLWVKRPGRKADHSPPSSA